MVVHQSDNSEVILTEIYNVPSSEILQVNQVAQWKNNGELLWSMVPSYQQRNFHGAVLKAAKMFLVMKTTHSILYTYQYIVL